MGTGQLHRIKETGPCTVNSGGPGTFCAPVEFFTHTPCEEKIPHEMCANLLANYKKRLTSDCQQGFCHQVLSHVLQILISLIKMQIHL